MTREQQRIAIAEAVGKDADYLNDLNAMHEAEKTLTKKQLQTYLDILADAPRESMYQTWSTSVFATASQRAEAFLRTIGKWEEGK